MGLLFPDGGSNKYGSGKMQTHILYKLQNFSIERQHNFNTSIADIVLTFFVAIILSSVDII